MSTSTHDQIDAATKHAENIVTQLGDNLGLSHQTEIAAGPVLTLVDQWRVATRPMTCAHLRSPQPVIGFLPLVGRVVCARQQCLRKLTARYLREIPRDQCDACGVKPEGNRFTEVTLRVGVAMLGGNVCRSCMTLAYPGKHSVAPDYAAGTRRWWIGWQRRGTARSATRTLSRSTTRY